jgi:hypothetical protein
MFLLVVWEVELSALPSFALFVKLFKETGKWEQ